MADLHLNEQTRKFLAPNGLSGSETASVMAFFALVVCGALLFLALPRSVPPEHLPALPPGSISAAAWLSSDKALAAQAPKSEEAQRLLRLYDQQGLAETGRLDIKNVREAAALRRREITSALTAFRKRHGLLALRALQAQALSRLASSLNGPRTERANQALLGSFPVMLERYGLVSEGRYRAPYPVIRALFKARWNFICGLPALEYFSVDERRLYYGWLALHAPEIPWERKLEAAQAYHQAGGARSDEMLGVLFFEHAQYERAFAAFSQAYNRTGALRLRNHALAARAAGAPPHP
ncbi:MAG: hypothetical protein H6715_01770 [Myxococcales bacterium]|nr:hypothetical protein [Myxococcales bacterium]MCB9707584.1 hypothetical protein [Myxococcales bacterium]